MEPDDGAPDLDELITCWCGAQGTYEELFDDEALEERRGGLGVVHCFCGGDRCVCDHHGETACPGCADCEPKDGDGYDPGPGQTGDGPCPHFMSR